MNYGVYLFVMALFFCLGQLAASAEVVCPPTPSDAEGPFYKPGAPIRDSTGRGLRVRGKVKSAGTCAPITGARVEWWQANPQEKYDDEHRGAQLTASDGSYSFETDPPPAYYLRPPHIHFKIFAAGHRPLTTQVYPKAGQSSISFDFVLIKE